MTRRFLLALAALLIALPAAAQTWPEKPVRLIVPFGPGSTPDVVMRLLADQLQQKLGQNFIVENKPGASGNIGTDAVAKAEPDGYTVGLSIGGPLGINPLLFGKLPYDPQKDIALVTLLTTQPSALAVNTSLGVNTVAELIDLLKKNPGQRGAIPRQDRRGRGALDAGDQGGEYQGELRRGFESSVRGALYMSRPMA